MARLVRGKDLTEAGIIEGIKYRVVSLFDSKIEEILDIEDIDEYAYEKWYRPDRHNKAVRWSIWYLPPSHRGAK